MSTEASARHRVSSMKVILIITLLANGQTRESTYRLAFDNAAKCNEVRVAAMQAYSDVYGIWPGKSPNLSVLPDKYVYMDARCVSDDQTDHYHRSPL